MIRYVLKIFLTGILLGSLSPRAVAKEILDDAALGFKLTLPEGFSPVPEIEKAMPRAKYGFLYGDAEDGKINVILFIVVQGKPLSHARLERSDLDPNFRGLLLRTIWQGLEVPLVEIPEEAQGMKAITLSVLIPLERQAINVKLLGPAERKVELRALLDQVVAGLSGRSNWPSSPSAFKPRPVGTGLTTAIMVGTVVVGLLIFWLISRYAPRGTVLAIALFLYIGSKGADIEVAGISRLILAPMGLIGFIGIILGIIDLVSRRKPRVPMARPVSEQATQAISDAPSQKPPNGSTDS